MKSRFGIGGHPFHPMLVTVPIGLFVWAFVADLIMSSPGASRSGMTSRSGRALQQF